MKLEEGRILLSRTHRYFLIYIQNNKRCSLSTLEATRIRNTLADNSYAINGARQETFNKFRELYELDFLIYNKSKKFV